jgi:hypothetical protein
LSIGRARKEGEGEVEEDEKQIYYRKHNFSRFPSIYQFNKTP